MPEATIDVLINDAVNQRVWAVVGASNNRSKFGNRIYRDLRAAGYTVYPVNPSEQYIEGDKAFGRLQDLPEIPSVVDVVVPASVGMRIADDARAVGARYFWLQPGAESGELVHHARNRRLNVIHQRCAMVEKRNWILEAQGR